MEEGGTKGGLRYVPFLNCKRRKKSISPLPGEGTWWFWYPWIPGGATSALVPFSARSLPSRPDLPWVEAVGKAGGYPREAWGGGNVMETRGVEGGVQVPKFGSHLTPFYHVSGWWKKKKKKGREGGQSTVYFPRRGGQGAKKQGPGLPQT